MQPRQLQSLLYYWRGIQQANHAIAATHPVVKRNDYTQTLTVQVNGLGKVDYNNLHCVGQYRVHSLTKSECVALVQLPDSVDQQPIRFSFNFQRGSPTEASAYA